MKKKSDTASTVLKFIKKLKSEENKTVKFIRCDNARENKKLQELLDDKGMGIKFKYTAVDIPQQNGKVERKFATLYGKV